MGKLFNAHPVAFTIIAIVVLLILSGIIHAVINPTPKVTP